MKNINTYREFQNKICETILYSYDIDFMISHINQQFDWDMYDYTITKLNKFRFDILFKNISDNYTEYYFNKLFNVCNLFNFFPCYYQIITTNTNKKYKGKYNRVKFEKLITDNVEILDTVKITCDSQYEYTNHKNIRITNNVHIPNKLYHIAPNRVISKIMKEGLLPNSRERLSSHPHRIYVFDNMSDTEISLLIEDFKHKDYKKYNSKSDKNTPEYIKNIKNIFYKYVLIEINTTKYIESKSNYLKDYLILHTDPGLLKCGFFTYDIIPATCLKIIKEY